VWSILDKICKLQTKHHFLMMVMIIILTGSAWVMDYIIPMCKRMGLAIEVREMELLAFLASLEANKKINQVDNQFDAEEVVGEKEVI